MTKKLILMACLATSLAGCKFTARAPEEYKSDTDKAIAAKQGDLKACYDEVLKADSKAAGVVKVKFTIAPETGAFQNVAVDEEATTAPAPLGECVVKILTGLKIDPPDAREGVVTWSYEFKANAPKQL
ncbi:MAG TPA: AgmX/PglI C-terminal domain-containing protein [Polyangiaceae bacterium]|nr:AgmX/PglI C-terminal domain-containing protein [Polyangiaceae bacterium]